MKLKTLSNRIFHHLFNIKLRKRLKNKTATIISSNCNGSFIMHDLHMRFNTPTVNLFIEGPMFIEFVKNLEYYLNCDLKQYIDNSSNYPKGIIDGKIVIHFLHYKNFNDAMIKWNIRKKRVDYSNIYVLMTDRDGFDDSLIAQFNEISYPKVLFSHKDYPDSKDIVCFDKYKNKDFVGILSNFSGWFGKREYDIFDYVNFFNSN